MHYWNVSKKYGHWNVEGHKIISESLSKFLSNLKSEYRNTDKLEK